MSGRGMGAKGHRPEAKAGSSSVHLDAALVGTDECCSLLANRTESPRDGLSSMRENS